jgi:hypothetical protein
MRQGEGLVMQRQENTREHSIPRKRLGRWRTLVALCAVAVAGLLISSASRDVAGGAITTPPFQLTDAGSLTLTTGATNKIERHNAANALVSTQAINVAGSCAISTTPTLLDIKTRLGVPGLNTGTLGDKTKGSGTDCGLVEAGGDMTLTLGDDVDDLTIRSFALDIETRKNLKLVLTAKWRGTTTATYQLRSGTSITPGGSSTPGSLVFDCNGGASSDPNAADRDNCRFSGNVLATQLVLRADVGEFGLAGGAAGGTTQPSVLELTQFDGLLDCESKPNSGDFDLSEGSGANPVVGVVRKDNLSAAEPCQLIPVDLQTSVVGGVPTVKFSKDLTNQLSAAFTIDVKWPTENVQDPPPLTQFEFVDGNPISLKHCVGTPVYDSGGQFDGIAELLDTNTSNDSVVPDLEPTAMPGKQYACYYSQDDDLVANGKMQLRQGIYLIGDWRSFR